MDKPMMEQQMELFRRGGLNDEGGEIDEVSGNEVPIGGTKKGVRDDVPAMVSEGEFVFPEDVVRYIGLDKLMQLRQQAKMGLKKMEAMGQMGNGDEATMPDDLPFDMADLIIVAGDSDEELEMQEGGFVTRPTTVRRTTQQPTYAQPPAVTMPDERPVFRSVRPLTPAIQRPAPSVIDFDKLMGDANINFKEYRNAEGKTLLVPFLGNSPIFPIPDGYTLYTPSTEDDQTEDTETVEEVNETLANVSVKEPNRSNRDDIVRNEFTEAGSWNDAPLDMYIKEARKFTNGTSSVATGIAGALSSPLGLFMYGATAHQKKRILATIDKRIQEARGTPVAGQVAELQKIKGILEGTIKPDSILNKITSTIGKIFAPDEIKQKTANTAVASTVGATGAVEESLRPRARPTAETVEDPYGIGAVGEFGGTSNIFDVIGPIEEVAARDVPVETSQTLTGDNIVGYQDGYEIRYVPDPKGDPERNEYKVINKNGEVVASEYTKRRSLDPNESLNGLKRSISNYVKSGQLPDGGIRYETQGMSRPSAVPTATVQQPTEETQTYDQELFNNLKNTISLGKIDDPRLPPEYRGGEGSEGYNRIISEAENFYGKNIVQDVLNSLTSVVPTPTRGVQDRGFVPSNIAQPAATAESIAPTPTRADYDISQLPPVQQPRVSPRLGYESGQDVLQSVAPYISSTIGQPSVSQIDYSDIQTSGPPSVPDAMRTPLGTAAAASARAQEATLPQPYDPSIDDLIEQTRKAIGTSGQTIKQTIENAEEAMGKKSEPKITEGTPAESTFKPSASPIVSAAKSITQLGRPTAVIDPRIDVSRQPTIEAPYPTQPTTALPAAPSYATMDMGEAGRTSILPPTIAPSYATMDMGEAGRTSILPPIIAPVQDPYGIGTAGEFAGMPTTPKTPTVSSVAQAESLMGPPLSAKLAPDVSLRPKARPTTFSDAFAAARAAGQKTFSFDGKEYTTELAEEKPAKAPAADKPKSGLDFNPATSQFKTKYERDEALAGNLGGTAAYEATMEVHRQGLAAKGISDKKDKPSTTTKPAATTTTRSKEDVQKEINDEIKKAGKDGWNSKLNDLVKERDAARAAPKPEAKKDSGGGGDKDSGGGGGGCVIATHGISTGGFSALDKAKAEIWCERTYHGKWYGEAFRRGYRYAGNKAIQKGKAEKHYQEFKDFVAYGRGIKKDWKSKINYYKRTIQFFLTGLIIKEDV
jgi:hypothetical protein